MGRGANGADEDGGPAASFYRFRFSFRVVLQPVEWDLLSGRPGSFCKARSLVICGIWTPSSCLAMNAHNLLKRVPQLPNVLPKNNAYNSIRNMGTASPTLIRASFWVIASTAQEQRQAGNCRVLYGSTYRLGRTKVRTISREVCTTIKAYCHFERQRRSRYVRVKNNGSKPQMVKVGDADDAHSESRCSRSRPRARASSGSQTAGSRHRPMPSRRAVLGILL